MVYRGAMSRSPLTTFRERAGKTIPDLAALVGVARSTAWRWESSDYPRLLPSSAELDAIAKALHLSAIEMAELAAHFRERRSEA